MRLDPAAAKPFGFVAIPRYGEDNISIEIAFDIFWLSIIFFFLGFKGPVHNTSQFFF